MHYHNKRFNDTRKIHFDSNPIDLKDELTLSPLFLPTVIKCRIVYDNNIQHISYTNYKIKEINSLKIISSNIAYQYKYLNRSKLNDLFNRRQKHDDILIIKDGMVTDSYYCNVSFLKDGMWYTPATPLLKGTMRSKLLEEKLIIEKSILAKEMHEFEKICLFNAMIDFGKITLNIDQIFA